MGLRYVSIVLALLLLVPLTAGAIYCTEKEPYNPNNPNCVYDVPGGEKLVGPGKEVVDASAQKSGDAHILVVRHLSVVRTGSVSYRMPGVAELYRETQVIFEIANEGKETAKDMEIMQPINGGQAHLIYVGDVGPGESKIVSFSIAGEYTDLGEPDVEYMLPAANIEVSEATVGEKVEVRLSINSVPIVGELVEIISPSGLRFNMKTDEEGKVAFLSREVGAYIFRVPHRETTSPAYVYSLGERVEPESTDEEEAGGEAGPGTVALVFGGLTSGAGDVMGAVGPLGISIVILLALLGGWTYIRMRKTDVEDELILGQDIPEELAKHKADRSGMVSRGHLMLAPSESTRQERRHTRDDSVSTEVDDLVRLVHEKGRIEVREAARILGVSPLEVEVGAKTLEEDNAIDVEYNLTRVYLVWKGGSNKLNGMMSDEQKRRLFEAAVVPSPKQLKKIGLEETEKPEVKRKGKGARKAGRGRKKK